MANEKLLIQGFCGEKRLRGTIRVAGAKNAAVKAMAASLLFADEISLSNVPDIEDVARVADLLRELGAIVQSESSEFRIDATVASKSDLATEISKRLLSFFPVLC